MLSGRRGWAAAGALMCAAACGGPPDEAAAPCVRDVVLTDVTANSPALADNRYGGAPGWDHVDKYGPGVALADLDGDGALDMVQPRSDRRDPNLRALVIYRGLGDGRFEEAARPAWDPVWNGTAAVAFDYDGDGPVDLFIGIDGAGGRLYRNNGDFAFDDVTSAAGLEGVAERVYAAAAGDITGNGFPDLYLGQWAADGPDHGAGLADNLLFENRGDGTFAPPRDDVRCEGRATLGVALVDLDVDGDVDIYVANDFFPDCLYENLGGGAFREIAAEAGTGEGANNGMGIGIGDVTDDGLLDIIVTDTHAPDDSPGHAVYVQREEPLRFDSAAQDLGLDGLAVLPDGDEWTVGWGVGVQDVSGDGRAEVHIATHEQREELVFARDGQRFAPVGPAMAALGQADARGTAYGDLTGDGAADVVVGRRGKPLQVIRNDSGGRYIEVTPVPAHRALGSVIVAHIGGQRRVAPIQAGSSYMSSSPPTARFGLCDGQRAERVEVQAPDGGRAQAADVGPRRLTLKLGPP